ncbi:hypothetical protein KIK06_15280 [Nocardiopsis sp. EMB25]|uniref:hypothetical protein n=1 Tax=Nocardiopsis sp. EMB25 TaxID=2835867 RepID=UPI002283E7F9|nr:hypothetical protein [Nocardiopsis sp. EMB25]MCY9785245.1 hypothetical protein [Nocardiopsis sp. EMB25]
MSTIAQSPTPLVTRVWRGAVAGVGGGIVFGMLMAMMGMLPMIAGMVGSDSALVGMVVHLVISAMIGAGFGLVAGSLADRIGAVLAAGAGYGMLWWVLGPLVAMPMMMGMPLFMINQMTMMSLMGHVIYGLVTAGVLFALNRRKS